MMKGNRRPFHHLYIGALAVLLMLVSWNSQAQDIHFSQFQVAPMNYNPALAGQFDGDLRFIANQRTQWRSVTVPYSTIGGSIDARNLKDVAGLGTGLSIYQDKAGDSHLRTLQINLAGSYLVPVSSDSVHTLSAGIHIGMTNRKIDYSELRYDSQWSGFSYNPGLSSNEVYARDARTYLNINAGIAWYMKPEKRKEFTAGISLFNINNPRQSYKDDDFVKLDTRLHMHIGANLPLNEDLDLMPSAMFQFQGTFAEMIFGTSVKYILNDEAGMYRTVFGGFYYRTKDAGYILAGMNYDQWRVGISYDINLSGLKPASNAKGGLEFSVVYIFKKFRPEQVNHRICPDYI